MPAYPGTEENSWWIAVGSTVLAIAAVGSRTAQEILPDDFTSHALGFSARRDSPPHGSAGTEVQNAEVKASPQTWAKRKEVTIMKGVVQKYSEKKEWGTISVHDSDSESDVETRVRFLRHERDRIDLKSGDAVIFRAVKDQQLQGWLLAETIWKAPERDRKAANSERNRRPQPATKQMD
eukprot:Skav201009  [mRNA]  locus=scaffold991:299499:301267:- [translate_table: standard]